MSALTSDRRQILESKIREVKSNNKLGLDIDDDLQKTIALLDLLGFPVLAAGGGSIEYGYPAPWIAISAPGMPEYIFINEKETWEKVAKKHNISIAEAKHDQKTWNEATKQYTNNDYTEEFIEYNKKNGVLYEKFQPLLEAFYKDRPVAKNLKIVLEATYSCGWFRIHNGGEDYEQVTRSILGGDRGIVKIDPSDKKHLETRLELYKKEMVGFTEFLKGKYFAE